jgi:cytochrome c-type biogenesis protein CcmH/NrfG
VSSNSQLYRRHRATRANPVFSRLICVWLVGEVTTNLAGAKNNRATGIREIWRAYVCIGPRMSGAHPAFWFIAGALCAAAAMLIAAPLLRPLGTMAGARRTAVAFAAALLLVSAAAVSLYHFWGAPSLLGTAPAHAAGGAGTAVESVESATLKLAERLASGGGSQTDWELLAQSYDYLGRSADALAARQKAAAQGAMPGKEIPAAQTNPIESLPHDVAAAAPLLAQAEQFRVAHDYGKSLEAYRGAMALDASNADAWASYADAAAAANGGKLAGPPAQYLQHALRLDASHPKALWLQASLLIEEHRYAEALREWQQLKRLLPVDSPDARIVAGNIAEAQQLADADPGAASVSRAAPARLIGEVEIDPALRVRAASGMTLFVFAKSSASPGPPLAVLRTKVDRWPVRFELNDSQAMLADRKLSNFSSVIVEARLSKNGQPLAQKGDLQGASAVVNPSADAPVRVLIDTVVGEAGG